MMSIMPVALLLSFMRDLKPDKTIALPGTMKHVRVMRIIAVSLSDYGSLIRKMKPRIR